MKHGSHQNQIPIEDFDEDEKVESKAKTPFFDDDESS